ncbi:protein-glutamate methylesterase/protein-glutamine glutaminase [Paenibacillus sanguinis]|uniref:protein-glutamate methylesterase/protein-glutamine glutaminase n=1 Tax=Paenibacillus sanguinis TaxID=225906 RepID=UPI000362C327|nr:chemotaxis response regulator protein-glutamate methylesterase [Paenibacillus sanguinis]
MPYRVLVVDDSAFMRKIISDLIEQDPAYRVEATAKNGREAVEQVVAIQPDLVTMDVEMPELNGLDALKVIMKEQPLPVIMLSGINEQGMRETIMALELGAFDFIRKPSATTSSYDIEEVGRELREQMRVAMLAKERRAARAAALDAAKAELPPAARKSRVSGPPPPATRAAASEAPGGAAPASPAPGASGSSSGTPAASLPRAPQPRAQTRLAGASPAAPNGGRATAGRRADKAPAEKARPPAGAAQEAPGGVTSAGAARPPRVSAPVDPPAPIRAAAGTAGPASEAGLRTSFTDLVAIGTSTGGPKALKAVLEKIPGDFPAPIVIVQHMPPNFTKSLAQRLNSLSQLTVVEAEQGERLHSGTAYIAPGGFHLNVVSGPGGGYRVHLTEQEPRNGHRPSVDVLYESLLPLQALKRHVVLLTGMGSDGAKVMKQLYDAGVTSTIAESEETCVVFGMPRSAIELNCVSHVLPLHDIGPKLVQVVK